MRDQNTFDEELRCRCLTTLLHLFLIHRYKAASIHYLTPTEDNLRQSEAELVREEEGAQLEAIARQGDCPSVLRETIPEADHVFTGLDGPLIDAVVSWLDGRV